MPHQQRCCLLKVIPLYKRKWLKQGAVTILLLSSFRELAQSWAALFGDGKYVWCGPMMMNLGRYLHRLLLFQDKCTSLLENSSTDIYVFGVPKVGFKDAGYIFHYIYCMIFQKGLNYSLKPISFWNDVRCWPTQAYTDWIDLQRLLDLSCPTNKVFGRSALCTTAPSSQLLEV